MDFCVLATAKKIVRRPLAFAADIGYAIIMMRSLWESLMFLWMYVSKTLCIPYSYAFQVCAGTVVALRMAR